MPHKGEVENKPVVFDIGEVYTKVGVNGDAEPRAIVPTANLNLDGTLSYIYKHDHKKIVGHQPDKNFRRNVYKFLETLYFTYIQVNPKQHSVVICESLVGSTVLRETIADVLFKDFEVPSLTFAPHHLLACFTIGRGTALVVDCSYGESVAIPVVQWTPVLWAWHAAPVGAAAIHDEIEASLMKQVEVNGKDIKLTEKIVEDIKIKTCFVTTLERAKIIRKNKSGQQQQQFDQAQKVSSVSYHLDGNCQLSISGDVREQSCEILFDQDNERTSVCTIALDCLLKCPMDTMKELSQNIILIGGTTMLPGFKHRFMVELNEIAKNEERYQEVLGECDFRLHKPPTQGNLVSWLGASILASLKEFRRKFVTKEYYHKHNSKLPDWCVTNLPAPEIMNDQQEVMTSQSRYSRTSNKSAARTVDSMRYYNKMKSDARK